MNKNWTDRADRDLFFAILNLKNIGIISGAEWISIGQHMRSLGYGFTNEGCRQHFQGLRRTQSKAEPGTDGVSAESPRNLDPSQNPITRRPGPGRGRPRKKPATPVEMPNRDKNQLPAPASVPVSLSASGPDPEPLALDPSLVAADEQAAKRPRLDDDPQDPSLEDEAVLNALAAHTNPNVVDHYGQEFSYGEA